MSENVITSTQNERVKLVYGLQTRPRTRLKERKIALEGMRLIEDALSRGFKAEFILYDQRRADYELVAAWQARKIPLFAVNEAVMQHMSDTQQPQGFIGVFPMPFPPIPKRATAALLLEAVREPGNMGTILRTAAAAGVEVVILSEDCVDPYNPKVLRAGMGAHFRLPIVSAKWHEIAQFVEGMAVYVADSRGTLRYSAADYTRPYVLVIGNEAHGARASLKLQGAQTVTIPMAAATESLNAAMAAAVLLFEAQRQRSV